MKIAPRLQQLATAAAFYAVAAAALGVGLLLITNVSL